MAEKSKKRSAQVCLPPSLPKSRGSDDDKPTGWGPYFDFRSGASWRIFRIMAEFIEGFEFLADIKNEVTIFGSARTSPDNHYYKEAVRLAEMLGKAGYTVITGGGPGIMEAANRGASQAGAVSVGLNIQLPKEQRINPYVNKFRGFYYFFTRKVMLSASAQAYIFFPGGYGTLDELMELLVLIQTKKMAKMPIILFGREFFGELFDWLGKKFLKGGYIDAEDLKLFQIVDTVEEAFETVKRSRERAYF